MMDPVGPSGGFNPVSGYPGWQPLPTGLPFNPGSAFPDPLGPLANPFGPLSGLLPSLFGIQSPPAGGMMDPASGFPDPTSAFPDPLTSGGMGSLTDLF